MDLLKIIGRTRELFSRDIQLFEAEISEIVSRSSFLVIGGAGSIGQAVAKELFSRNPQQLHVVDINENNLVELVRDIRSSLGYIEGDFRTFVLDCCSDVFKTFMDDHQYDYIINLSALKHVRSEKDPYTLMRMIEVNCLSVHAILECCIRSGIQKYFCVSTDKAANPVNMMGASKRIMEMFLFKASRQIHVSTARFANVAFSDGSLLHGFRMRLQKKQPLSAPLDVERYFITSEESGRLCLMSCLLGDNRDVFFPKLGDELRPIRFSDIAIRYLEDLGYEPYICDSEEAARNDVGYLIQKKKWPCYFFESDTTGEKGLEEFYTQEEIVDMYRFDDIGVIKYHLLSTGQRLSHFNQKIIEIRKRRTWNKNELVALFDETLSNFQHIEKHKSLDERM